MYNIFQHFRDYLRLREAIKTADAQYEKNKDRYYVLPSQDGKLVVLNRFNFKRLKLKHYITQKANIYHIRRECFYHTPYANGLDAMPDNVRKERAEAYYAWCNFTRIGKRRNKK